MRQERFEKENQALWDRLAEVMDDLERPRSRRLLQPSALTDYPRLYRRLCSHYALARSRGFSPMLVAYLHRLVLRGHPLLYKRATEWVWRLLTLCCSVFPRPFVVTWVPSPSRRYSFYCQRWQWGRPAICRRT